MTGTATFSVHVSILFFSETFTLQASYTFAGGSGGAAEAMLEPYFDDPRRRGNGLSQAAFLVAPEDGGPMKQKIPREAVPVFVSRNAWVAYMNAFDL